LNCRGALLEHAPLLLLAGLGGCFIRKVDLWPSL
jgi:hypothetical protein